MPSAANRAKTDQDARNRSVAPLLRQTYRLTIACHGADVRQIELELRRLFHENRLVLDWLRCDKTSFAFITITASLAGSIADRAAMVRIVNQLAPNPLIRRLQWETVRDSVTDWAPA
jgi:virulence factor MgtC-like protein